VRFRRIQPRPGQESVWDYPRPPHLERAEKRILIEFGGKPIVDAVWAWRVLETSHPPTYYIPPEFIHLEFLRDSSTVSHCEWKGQARYYHVEAGGRVAENAAWCYPDPMGAFRPMKECVAFYAGPMDLCTVDAAPVQPQPGGFYGGWITPDIVGPFKGGPGTWGW
jgi:uncharacterized protein (DUF427 family)